MWEKLKARLKTQGLTEEQIQAIVDGMKEDKVYLSAEENIDVRYTKLKADKETVDRELKSANETIKDLKKTNVDNEALQKTIKDHEATIKQLQDEATNTSKLTNLKEKLREGKVKDVDYLIYKHGGLDKFIFDKENKPVGVEDILKGYRENEAMAHLFEQEQQRTPYTPVGGGTGSNAINPFAKESFNLTEQGRLFKENPDQARQLAQAAGVNL